MKKQILTMAAFALIAASVSAQQAAKINGQPFGQGDWFGSNNNEAVTFKANNNVGLKIKPNGELVLKSLDLNSNTGPNGLVLTDGQGKLFRLNFPNDATKVLLGNGTFGVLPSTPQWLTSGSNLYWNAGNVSIGSVPNSFKLNVEGDVRVSHDLFVNNNMYVGGGIVISDKIQGVTEVKGWNFKVENDLQVTGTTRFNGLTQLDQGFTFDGSKGIKFIPGQDNGGTFRYGNNNLLQPLGVPCAAGPYSPVNHQFGGWLQIYDYNNPTTSGMLNLQTWTGGSSIDASVGSQTGGGGLLLNYFCGNNTYINTGANGGEIFMGKTHIGGVTSATAPHVNALLSVGGDVVAKAVYVTQKDWADFVFEPTYKLMPFDELQNYYQINKHLPNVPSTKEISENGNDLANTDKVLLQKIEESYLYMAEMMKQIEELKQKNTQLELQLNKLTK